MYVHTMTPSCVLERGEVGWVQGGVGWGSSDLSIIINITEHISYDMNRSILVPLILLTMCERG